MARQGWGRHSTVATGSDSGDQVSVNAWNADINKAGMLGFTAQTIASATSISPTNSTIILSGSTDVSTIAITDTAEYDLLYVFTSGSVTLVNTSSPSSDGHIRLLANANKDLSTTTPTILIRKDNYWYEYGGGITNSLSDIGDVTITSPSEHQSLFYNGSNWYNNSPDKLIYVCKNATASTIAAGKIVYVSGFHTASSTIEISLADNSSASSMPAFGFTMESIAAGGTGKILQQGQLENLNTDSIAEGTTLYVGTSGNWSTTKPTGTALIQNIGKVLKDNASTGIIHVGGSGRSNDLPNLANGKTWIGNASGVPTETTLATSATTDTTNAANIADGTVSNTEFQYINSLTSNAQTQLDAKQATLTFGIANTNAVKIDSADAASGEYAKLTASGIESKSFAEVKTDLSLNNVENTAISTFAGSTNITTLGTIATGTWSATAIGETKGGTGQTTYTQGDILYASGANTLSKLAKGTAGQVLTINSGATAPEWATSSGGASTLLDFKYQASGYSTPTYTTRTVNDASTPVQMWVKDIDTNNQGIYIRIKKNGTYTNVQIA